ncbi:MAG: esterase-like activity of phytase family protein [Pseudomonadota bacterium]
MSALIRGAALGLAVFCGLALAEEGWTLTEGGRSLEIEAAAIPVPPSMLGDTVRQTGAWHLTASDPSFGGLSGLLLDGRALTAVTDKGDWLTAELRREGGRLTFSNARMAPMIGGGGKRLARRGGDFADAEGLALTPTGLAVSLERVHRAILYTPDGTPVAVHQERRFNGFANNGGIEGLASLPDGALLALIEEPEADGIPVMVLRHGSRPLEGRLAAPSRHSVTGADIGPDGRLYVVFRHFSPATGVSIRLRRYALGEDGLPLSDSREELAAWEALSGIDNMEAVAVVSGAGGLTAWILSDDNFNAKSGQRTLLLSLSIAD